MQRQLQDKNHLSSGFSCVLEVLQYPNQTHNTDSISMVYNLPSIL